ncbi:long-chain-fatty-acid--CoA ligase FadD17 [Mycobacterium parascrofulaceum]|uniref:long-chain-fatty-acid--CoA ligase FadD17 n=1 Tax=Mycobacterium parascrofulaceum TaxID=240125 RepID=UPI0002E7FCEE|nr:MULTISPECIES: long-chain-fatty-acid--CoA ligase FadD17 [Mycobacterium]OCB32118.1 acyl-CoA synthetase [Mycobacterium malmoense]
MLPPDPTVTKLLVPLAEIDDRGVYFEDSHTSWREHLRHGAAIAAALRDRLDPAKPPHVGVLLENTPFFSAMLTAAGMSGIVPVGLNPVRRGDALARDIAHADCQLVLADSNSAVALGGIDHVDVDSAGWADEVAAHGDAEPRFQTATAGDLFMLIFTSGTSGEPKAVKCSHGKVAIAGVTMTQRFGLGRDDVCYVSMPLFHSNAVLVGWAVAAACRGSLALRRKFSASNFLVDVRRFGATYANYVGKPLSYVLATPERPDDADNPLRAVYGNEGVPRDIERFARRFGCVVQDGFGSTEGGVAIARTSDTPEGALGPLPEGVEIVDPDTGAPCAPGVVGELVNTAGAGRFEGYYNDEAAEAERMAGGVYHTGDLAYRDEAGYAYFAGRLGDWMRVDGENLGAAPIERVLLRHPDVTEVAVYAVPDPVVGDQVMAALVLAPGAEFDAEKFRAFLAGQPDLGPKQWPSYVRVSAELPRTVTFKVLKRQLAAQGLECDDPVVRIEPQTTRGTAGP